MQVNGLELHVDDQGDGAPVLLLHGWPDSSHLWRGQVPVLNKAGLRTIAPDMHASSHCRQNPVGDLAQKNENKRNDGCLQIQVGTDEFGQCPHFFDQITQRRLAAQRVRRSIIRIVVVGFWRRRAFVGIRHAERADG